MLPVRTHRVVQDQPVDDGVAEVCVCVCACAHARACVCVCVLLTELY